MLDRIKQNVRQLIVKMVDERCKIKTNAYGQKVSKMCSGEEMVCWIQKVSIPGDIIEVKKSRKIEKTQISGNKYELYKKEENFQGIIKLIHNR